MLWRPNKLTTGQKTNGDWKTIGICTVRPSRRACVATATTIPTIAVEATIAIVCLKVFWFLILGYCEHVTMGLYSLLALHLSHNLNS